MRTALLSVIAASCLAVLSVMLAFSIRNNKKIKSEKEALILKNDSLHIREIKTKKELLALQKQLDSLMKNTK